MPFTTMTTLSRRKFTQMLALGLSTCALGLRPAFGSPINASAFVDFNAGKWRQAADQASQIRDANNLAFAARSLLASALLSPSSRNRNSTIAQARQFAEAALIFEPTHIEGRLQLATALGLQARSASPARAFAAGLPQRVKRLLDSVLRDDPTQSWAFALLGGWHLEGFRIGGNAAKTLLGVDLQLGQMAFARAIRLDPLEAATPFYFAASLLALNPVRNAPEARALLLLAKNAPTRDAFQAEVKLRAGALLAAIDEKGPALAAAMALGWL
jgi:hypothetical protein